MNDCILPLPTSKKIAKELGIKFYFTGKQCKHGHVCERYIGGPCVECNKISSKKRYENNPDIFRERSRKHRENNPDYHLEYNRKHRENNPDYHRNYHQKYYEENSELYSENQRKRYEDKKEDILKCRREYVKNNRDKRNALAARRRAQKSNSTPLYVAKKYKQKESKEQKAEFKDIRKLMNDQIEEIYAESRRLTEETGIPHHVDHIYPITHDEQTGLHVPWNLQILTETENTSKHNKLPNDSMSWHLHELNKNRVQPDPRQQMIQD